MHADREFELHPLTAVTLPLQALNELNTSLAPFLEKNPAYKKALAVVQIPERVIQFRVIWEDDKGQTQVNRGFRVQVSSSRRI